jgi:hypothetical protein
MSAISFVVYYSHEDDDLDRSRHWLDNRQRAPVCLGQLFLFLVQLYHSRYPGRLARHLDRLQHRKDDGRVMRAITSLAAGVRE